MMNSGGAWNGGEDGKDGEIEKTMSQIADLNKQLADGRLGRLLNVYDG